MTKEMQYYSQQKSAIYSVKWNKLNTSATIDHETLFYPLFLASKAI